MALFEHLVTTESELRALVGGTPGERAQLKERGALDAQSRGFIAMSPFLLMATSAADGTCDMSPRGDAPGFVHVLDDDRLVIPERNGNKRLDGLTNLLSNRHVGLLFIVPGCDYTLRINGRAWITRDPALLGRMPAQGVTPRLAIGVAVQQSFFHCVKAFRRARLWAHVEWPDSNALPSYACTVFNQIRPDNATIEEYERSIAESDSKLYV
jgi:PPOX class probable FMN-dependent enzyme